MGRNKITVKSYIYNYLPTYLPPYSISTSTSTSQKNTKSEADLDIYKLQSISRFSFSRSYRKWHHEIGCRRMDLPSQSQSQSQSQSHITTTIYLYPTYTCNHLPIHPSNNLANKPKNKTKQNKQQLLLLQTRHKDHP